MFLFYLVLVCLCFLGLFSLLRSKPQPPKVTYKLGTPYDRLPKRVDSLPKYKKGDRVLFNGANGTVLNSTNHPETPNNYIAMIELDSHQPIRMVSENDTRLKRQ